MKQFQSALRGAVVGLVAAAVVLALALPGLLDGFENRTYDARARLLVRETPATDRVRLVLVDQATLDHVAQAYGISWPWPREVHGVIVDFLTRSGAAAVGYDVIFETPSLYGVTDDRAFGVSAARNGSLAAAVFGSLQQSDDQRLPVFSVETGLIPQLEEGARQIGHVRASLDSDGIVRRLAVAAATEDGGFVPSLGMAIYLAAEPDTEVSVSGDVLLVGNAEVPLLPDGRSLLRYNRADGIHQSISAAAIIDSEIAIRSGTEPTVQPSELTGKYVIVGYSAPGLFDLRPNPMNDSAPGATAHATTLENLLAGGDFIRRPGFWADVVLILLVALGAGTIAGIWKSAVGDLIMIIVGVAIPTGIAFWAYAAGVWLPLVGPALAGALAAVGAALVDYFTEGKDRRFIEGALGQYLSPKMVARLKDNPRLLALGGEERELSIFFSDLQGFTSISEKLTPTDLTSLLNEYLSEMTDIITDSDGTIDKYEGDAIIAFWNAPLDVVEHAVRGVRAAIHCQTRLTQLRPDYQARYGSELRMRIGMNTGLAVVGNLGSRTRFDYTMLSDAVNLAARLEGVNKVFGTFTMISEDTRSALQKSGATVEVTPEGTLAGAGDIGLRRLGSVRVVGRVQPVSVYEAMEPADLRAGSERFGTFARALASLEAGNIDTALGLLEQVRDADPAAQKYLARYATAAAGESPVWNLTSK